MARGVQYACYIDETGFYLGDAGQVSSFFSRDGGSVTSAWVPSNTDGTLVLIQTRNVQSLWRALGYLGERYKAMNELDSMDQTVHLFMPCGTQYRFVGFDDFPWTSLPCSCGSPHHWVIRYTDAADSRPQS